MLNMAFLKELYKKVNDLNERNIFFSVMKYNWLLMHIHKYSYQHIYHKQGRFYQTPNEFNEQLRSGSEYFNPKVKPYSMS